MAFTITTIKYNNSDVSIAEIYAVEELYKQIAVCYNTVQKHSIENKDVIATKLYVVYRFIKSIHEGIVYKRTNHNNAEFKSNKGMSNFYKVDDSLINSFGCLDIKGDVEFRTIKLLINELKSVEDSIFFMISSLYIFKYKYIEFLSISRVNVIEIQFMLEHILETKYKEKVDSV